MVLSLSVAFTSSNLVLSVPILRMSSASERVLRDQGMVAG
jgi:hypothetical protein